MYYYYNCFVSLSLYPCCTCVFGAVAVISLLFLPIRLIRERRIESTTEKDGASPVRFGIMYSNSSHRQHAANIRMNLNVYMIYVYIFFLSSSSRAARRVRFTIFDRDTLSAAHLETVQQCIGIRQSCKHTKRLHFAYIFV